MKKALFAIAALATGAAAHAQTNVSIYGLMDTGVEYTNHASAGGNSVVKVTSGGQNTSRFGFKGTEDLGGGLKAVFQLEGGLFLDTGASDGNLFKRQANVGLEGKFGRLVLGRSFSTTYDFILPFDPMGYAPLYSWVTSGNGSDTVSKYGMPTAFDNMIKYQGEFGGVKVGASYGAGEVAGSTANGAKYNVGLAYDMGPFSAAVTADRQNGATVVAATGERDRTTTYHVGLGYEVVKGVDLKAGYRWYKLQGGAAATPELRSDLYWIGANYQATPALGLTAVVYYQNEKERLAATPDADPKMLVLRAKYALSKRTFLYASTAYAKAKNDQPVGLTRDNTAGGGTSGFSDAQFGTIVGIQHRF